jgi:hypothetical protein
MYKEGRHTHIAKATRSTVNPAAQISPSNRIFVKIAFGENFIIRKVL